jgi:hypothetical protein
MFSFLGGAYVINSSRMVIENVFIHQTNLLI